jgi:Inner membrane protein YgaP-like, transmembrane domain
MTVERGLRMMAGTVILVSMALAHFFSPYWHLLTTFVGLNLLQSAFTNWCPGMVILRRTGFQSCTISPALPASKVRASSAR